MLEIECYMYGYEYDDERVPEGVDPCETKIMLVECYKKDEKFLKKHHVLLDMELCVATKSSSLIKVRKDFIMGSTVYNFWHMLSFWHFDMPIRLRRYNHDP